MNYHPSMNNKIDGFSVINCAHRRYWDGMVADLWDVACSPISGGSYVGGDPRLFILLKTEGSAPGLRVLDPKTAQAVRHMLHLATQSGGTAPKAQATGYSVGGKTGTAHKQEGKGYADKKYRGWFVGIAPVDKPRIVVAVMIDEPSAGRYYGGDVAAPVFSATVQQTLRMLGVQPDMNVKPQIVVQAVEESF